MSSINRAGTSAACANTFGRAIRWEVKDAAAAPDGTLLLLGRTGPDFAATPGTLQTQAEPGDDAPGFLMQLDPCGGSVRFATFFPAKMIPSLLAVAGDGSVFVSLVTEATPYRSRILHIDAAGRRILAQTEWPGVGGQMVLDARGRLHLAGRRDNRAVAVRFDPELTKIEYESVLEDTLLSYGGAIAIEAGGGVYVASGVHQTASAQGLGLSGSSAARPELQGQNTMLARLSPDGAVVWKKTIDTAIGDFNADFRAPIGLDVDANGVVWAATFGGAGFPEGQPADDRVSQTGIRLMAWNRDETPAGARLFIPGIQLNSVSAMAVSSASGRVLLAGYSPGFPVTPNAFTTPTGTFSVLSFDRSVVNGPAVLPDRQILEVGYGPFLGSQVQLALPISFQTSGGVALSYTAGLLSSSSPTGPAFGLAETTGSLPGSISIASKNNVPSRGTLIVLVPGAQGITYIPLRNSGISTGFLFRLNKPLETDTAFTTPVSSTMDVSYRVPGNSTIGALPVPFTVRSTTPWLRVEQSTGITPATITLTADPAGLPAGVHIGNLRFQAAGVEVPWGVTFRIGSFATSPDINASIPTPQGRTVSHTFTLDSGGPAFDFTITTSDSWLQATPLSGRTPAKVTITATPPPGRILGDSRPASLTVAYNGLTRQFNFTFPLVLPSDSQPPDSVTRRRLGPGALFSFTLYGAGRCDAEQAQTAPWPTSRGGCTLRLNGTALPVGSIVTDTISQWPNQEPYTAAELTAQLPYQLPALPWTLELEDKTGARKSLRVEEPFAEAFVRDTQAEPIPVVQGQEVTLRVSGLGLTNGDAPWGDVPTTALSALVPVQVSAGGTTARLRSVELSRTEVGIFLVKFEVPALGPGVHPVHLLIRDAFYNAGSLGIAPPKGLAAIQNSASYTNNTVTPGGIVTLYGTNLGPADLATFNLDASLRIPTRLAGSRVFFNGQPAPLLYTSAGQLSAIVPFSLAGQRFAQVTAESSGAVAGSVIVPVLPADPGLYSLNQSGTGPGATLNQDGSINTPDRPAAPGSIVVLFGAGFGATEPLLQDGQLTPTVNPPKLAAPVTVTIGEQPAEVIYAGPAPGAVAGLYQVNVRVPAGTPAGNIPVKVTAGGAASQTGLTVAVAPR